MSEKYFPPKFQSDNFHCPNCDVYAHQNWYDISYSTQASSLTHRAYHGELYMLYVSICKRCDEFTLWYNQKLIHPRASLAPLPVENMPQDVKEDYLEARSIVSDSPRAAAALLRLALQKLMIHLGEKGKKLDDDIASLFEKGLPKEIQIGLDFVRVIGNNAVHPGEIDLKDDVETATNLFSVINMIIRLLITQPKELVEMVEKLPEGARKAIEKRDKE